MTSTYSATLRQSAMIWEDQTSLAGQESQSTVTDIGNTMYRRDHIQFLDAIDQLADSTSDGGVRVRPNSSLFITWSIFLQVGRISKVLPRPNLSEKIIANTTVHPLFLIYHKTLPPHLDAIRWIETTTGFSQERIGKMIGVTRQTISGWKRGLPINDPNRRRLLAVRGVLERASLRHPTPNELAAWLDTPRGADGRTPAQLLEANEIDRARLHAVSSPSPRLRQAPSWVN